MFLNANSFANYYTVTTKTCNAKDSGSDSTKITIAMVTRLYEGQKEVFRHKYFLDDPHQNDFQLGKTDIFERGEAKDFGSLWYIVVRNRGWDGRCFDWIEVIDHTRKKTYRWDYRGFVDGDNSYGYPSYVMCFKGDGDCNP